MEKQICRKMIFTSSLLVNATSTGAGQKEYDVVKESVIELHWLNVLFPSVGVAFWPGCIRLMKWFLLLYLVHALSSWVLAMEKDSSYWFDCSTHDLVIYLRGLQYWPDSRWTRRKLGQKATDGIRWLNYIYKELFLQVTNLAHVDKAHIRSKGYRLGPSVIKLDLQGIVTTSSARSHISFEDVFYNIAVGFRQNLMTLLVCYAPDSIRTYSHLPDYHFHLDLF